MTKANRGSGGWYSGSTQKKKYTNLVASECIIQGLEPIKDQVDIFIKWTCKDKRRDKDNIMAGQKFILDGLVEAGILKNDGWSEIGELNNKFEIGKPEKITITLEKSKK